MSLIWSIPVGVLLAAGFLIFLINRGKSTYIGAAWFAAILAGVFVWGWTVSFYFRPDVQIISLSDAFSAYSGQITRPGRESVIDIFVLDGISYPFMLSVSALLVILLLTAPSYLDSQSAPRLWIFYLLITAIGYLSVSANNVRFIIYGWVVFDAIDLTTQYLQARPEQIPESFLTAVGIRFVGTLLAASSLALSASESPPGFNAFISLKGGAYLFTACALRMGIMPISQPYSSTSRVGLGTMLRLVSVLTVIPVMCRIPTEGIRPNVIIVLRIAGLFASITGAVGWLLSENSFTGNTYAAMAICGMTFVCALNGAQESLIIWGVSIALTCAPLSLYRTHNPFMNVLAFLVILCFSGLPYMPNAFGWNGLMRNSGFVGNALFVLVMAFWIAGASLHVLRSEGRKFSELEPWMRSVYPIGFFVAIGTHVFISMTGFPIRFTVGIIPASVCAVIGGVLLTLSVRYMPEGRRTQNTAAWGQALISLFWKGMQKLLDMEWLMFISRWFWKITNGFFMMINNMLENNGGLVWEFLLLFLLLAAAFNGSTP